MKFITKNKLIHDHTTHYERPHKKPSTCPFCGIDTDGTIRAVGKHGYKTGKQLWVVPIACTQCGGVFIALYEYYQSNLEFMQILPQPVLSELEPCFGEISPRFIEAHKEAEAAEIHGLTDLAAIGYRKALEILVKDYAIKEIGEPEEKVVNVKLIHAIGQYLHQDDLVKTADVVRILGNDRTHYREKYPDIDFATLKHYYKVFLTLVQTQYSIKHPPVSR